MREERDGGESESVKEGGGSEWWENERGGGSVRGWGGSEMGGE